MKEVRELPVLQPQQRRKGYALLVTAALACPCHLPIFLALLAGTTLGAVLQQNLALVLVGLTVYFIFALVQGLKMLNRQRGRREAP
ncbi:MAG: mercury resistance protein [candidate division NC10 bacterium]|nr:mercury resistance protein [candidate division NC10 bacterium]